MYSEYSYAYHSDSTIAFILLYLFYVYMHVCMYICVYFTETFQNKL